MGVASVLKKIAPVLIGVLTSLGAFIFLVCLALGHYEKTVLETSTLLFGFAALLSLVYFIVFYWYGGDGGSHNIFLSLLADIVYFLLVLLSLFLCFLALSIGNLDPSRPEYAGISVFEWAFLFTSFCNPLLPIGYLLVHFFIGRPRRFFPFVNLIFYLVSYFLSLAIAAIYLNSSGGGIAVAVIFCLLLIIALVAIHVREAPVPFALSLHREKPRKREKKQDADYRPSQTAGSLFESERAPTGSVDFDLSSNPKELFRLKIETEFMRRTRYLCHSSLISFPNGYSLLEINISSKWWGKSLAVQITYVMGMTQWANPNDDVSAVQTCYRENSKVEDILSDVVDEELEKTGGSIYGLSLGFDLDPKFNAELTRI